MELTKQDVSYIVNELGYEMKDIPQIKAALKKTKFTQCTPKDNGVIISADSARKILGDRPFLSGISRSAFHWSAVRQKDDGTIVYFDSNPYFKK